MNHRCFKAHVTLRRLVFVLEAKQRWRHQQPAGVCRVVGDCSAIKPSARTPTTARGKLYTLEPGHGIQDTLI